VYINEIGFFSNSGICLGQSTEANRLLPGWQLSEFLRFVDTFLEHDDGFDMTPTSGKDKKAAQFASISAKKIRTQRKKSCTLAGGAHLCTAAWLAAFWFCKKRSIFSVISAELMTVRHSGIQS
jgi:hypothetical protein